MSSAELPLSVAQIGQMEGGRPVAVFVGTITDVYEFKTNIGKNASDCQTILLTDPEGGKVRATCWNHPDYKNKKGAKVRIVSAFEKGRASTTVKLNTYYDPPRAELQVNKASIFLFAGSSTSGAATTRQSGNESNRQAPAPVRPQVRAGATSAPPAGPINGQTVGANVKLAVEIVTRSHPENIDGPLHEFAMTAEFSRRVWTVASDLIRVAQRLEAGKLAPSANDRQGSYTPQDQEPDPVPEPEPEPEPQYETTAPAPRQHNRTPGPDGAAFPQDEDPDNVPF